MPALVEEAHEGGLEVPRVAADERLEVGRRAGEEDLAVGQHEHAVGVALGLADVVRGEDDRRPAARRAGR